MNAPLVSLRGVRVALPDRSARRWFGRRPQIDIVKGVDLDIAPGEALGLVGESGSGKTTLGRTLVRLLRPSAGTLTYDGHDIGGLDERELRPLRQKLQIVFQNPQTALNPRLTIGSTLARPLEAYGRNPGRGERRRRVAELLDLVALPSAFASRYPHEISGGQRQRVGIARALALEPEFIVADEVVSGLDVSTQAQILLLLRGLRERLNLTLVFISHDLSVVRVLCDRVAVMSNGEIVETGETAAVFAAPQHPYTQELLASVPLPDVDPDWIASDAKSA